MTSLVRGRPCRKKTKFISYSFENTSAREKSLRGSENGTQEAQNPPHTHDSNPFSPFFCHNNCQESSRDNSRFIPLANFPNSPLSPSKHSQFDSSLAIHPSLSHLNGGKHQQLQQDDYFSKKDHADMTQEQAFQKSRTSSNQKRQEILLMKDDPSHPSKLDISRQEFLSVMNYSQKEAAQILGVSLSTLKRRFYEVFGYGKRWSSCCHSFADPENVNSMDVSPKQIENKCVQKEKIAKTNKKRKKVQDSQFRYQLSDYNYFDEFNNSTHNLQSSNGSDNNNSINSISISSSSSSNSSSNSSSSNCAGRCDCDCGSDCSFGAYCGCDSSFCNSNVRDKGGSIHQNHSEKFESGFSNDLHDDNGPIPGMPPSSSGTHLRKSQDDVFPKNKQTIGQKRRFDSTVDIENSNDSATMFPPVFSLAPMSSTIPATSKTGGHSSTNPENNLPTFSRSFPSITMASSTHSSSIPTSTHSSSNSQHLLHTQSRMTHCNTSTTTTAATSTSAIPTFSFKCDHTHPKDCENTKIQRLKSPSPHHRFRIRKSGGIILKWHRYHQGQCLHDKSSSSKSHSPLTLPIPNNDFANSNTNTTNNEITGSDPTAVNKNMRECPYYGNGFRGEMYQHNPKRQKGCNGDHQMKKASVCDILNAQTIQEKHLDKATIQVLENIFRLD